VSHANAALTPRHRLRLARLIVDEGWPVSHAAAAFQVSWPTANRWAQRYRQAGEAGMTDRSSRPHHSPRRTPQPVVRRIVHLRWKQRLGPVEIAARIGVAPSTAHQVLRRCRLHRLSHVDRLTGEPVRRYEHDRPGALLHVDVKKLGNIPDGGGWRYVGRIQGSHHRAATPGKPRNAHGNPKLGTAFVHTVLDDHSRVAYAEVHDDETAATAIGVLRRAVDWFASRGITVERVLSDNGSAYRSHAWRDACLELGITPKRTRPYRPQTNGKIERFHRTLADGWAFRRMFLSESIRRKALPGWLHEYNHHRPHTAIGRRPPISRLTNLSGQYS
jgi:transposase InsO family protein